MTKIIQLVDELGLTWSIVEADALHPALSSADLDVDEYACWRELFLHKDGLLSLDRVEESEVRLIEISSLCETSTRGIEDLERRLVHASRAYTTVKEALLAHDRIQARLHARATKDAGTDGHRAPDGRAQSDPECPARAGDGTDRTQNQADSDPAPRG